MTPTMPFVRTIFTNVGNTNLDSWLRPSKKGENMSSSVSAASTVASSHFSEIVLRCIPIGLDRDTSASLPLSMSLSFSVGLFVSCARLVVANPATSSPGYKVKILRVNNLVTTHTVSFGCIACREACAAKNIYLHRYRFKMGGVAARAVAAKMIDGETLRYFSYDNFVNDSVNHFRLIRTYIQPSIASRGAIASPIPALVINYNSFSNVFGESAQVHIRGLRRTSVLLIGITRYVSCTGERSH